ncbi:Protein of unknown function DUF1685 [Macleaya cordata]|uniref:Uncharacterized protein n=1 Tax=Macleaya cordata TaxID=56857 RepID=A0A200QYW0_MACCD|nr:Protein of unknown function DUF1685 [Macleaya cordata]
MSSEGKAAAAPPSGPPPPARPLYKQRSWSSDTYRDEAWLRRKGNYNRRRRSKSVTDDDLDELKGCIELGFGFDSPDLDRKLSDTLPALELYLAVNKQYNDSVFKTTSTTSTTTTTNTANTSTTTSSSSTSSSCTASDCDASSPIGSPHTIFEPGDNPKLVKTRLRQWALVVACSVRQSCS